jgi:hypothetical protein
MILINSGRISAALMNCELTRAHLHPIVDFDRIGEVLEPWCDLSDPLLKVEDVYGELVGLGAGGTKQLSRVLHEGLVGLQIQ